MYCMFQCDMGKLPEINIVSYLNTSLDRKILMIIPPINSDRSFMHIGLSCISHTAFNMGFKNWQQSFFAYNPEKSFTNNYQ